MASVLLGGPLLVWKSPKMQVRGNFWHAYANGRTRTCTAWAMAYIIARYFPIPEMLVLVGGGEHLASLRATRVRSAMVVPDLMALAFQNAVLAHFGSIRQSHAQRNWIQKLEQGVCGLRRPARGGHCKVEP